MRIFHIATAQDWRAAMRVGSYTTSTRGRTLAEEGFLHASHREQVPAVFERFYAGLREPLVLLTIETDRLSVPWREDQVGEESYPHIYGPLTPAAVVDVQPLGSRGQPEAFISIFLRESMTRAFLALLAMTVSVLGVLAGSRLDTAWGPFAGGVAGLAIGALIAVVLLRRRG